MEYQVIVGHDRGAANWEATAPDLPDVVGVGATSDEAIAHWRNAAREYLAFMAELRRDLPPPTDRIVTVTL